MNTPLQIEILTLVKDEYMTCDDIAFELKRHRMHIGNSVKALVKKGELRAWYNYPDNPKYISII